MACVLCFGDSANAIEHFIDIFSEEGDQLDICKIISQHLWFTPNKEICFSQCICWNCWSALRDFNAFYNRVAELHLTDWKYPFTCVEQNQENDPLPHENELKFEEVPDNAGKLRNKVLNDNSFDGEVKSEARDIDVLPQIEIIEDFIALQKRGRPRKNENEKRTTTRSKRNKKTEITTLPISNDNDSENELPLSLLLGTAKTDVANVENPTEISDATAQNIKSDDEKIHETQQKKRRGRPKKVKRNEPSTLSTADDAKEQSNVADLQSSIEITKSEIKVENTTFDCNSDDNDNNPDMGVDTNDLNNATEDSDSSSTTDTDDDDDAYEPEVKYAVITKKKVVKPKKYRKRGAEARKPLNPMTREEIEAKKAEQEEYERMIQKFFVRISCSQCELFVHNFAELRVHLRGSHNIDPGYMLCCGRKFFQRKTLSEHILLHWNPEHFKCKICGENCTSSRHLAEHEDAHVNPPKPKEKKSFQCDQCENVYTSKITLEHHVLAKHVPKSEYKFACTDCNKVFPTKNALGNHKRKSHDPNKFVICDKCGKQLHVNYIKKHHLLEHSEDPRPTPEPQQCQICGAWLRHMSGLKQHIKRIHEDADVEHRCQICNRVSTTARALKRHILYVHECVRKFKCTMCEKAFKRPQDLREHTSVHTGKVLYNCPNCTMTFFSAANMYKHRQRRHRAEHEADKKKPRHLKNILGQSRNRVEDGVTKGDLPSALNRYDNI